MQRHFVSALFLAAFLAAPAVAAEKSRGVGGAVAPSASKESKKSAPKKKAVGDKPLKVAQAEKPASAKNPVKTTRRMRGYGN